MITPLAISDNLI